MTWKDNSANETGWVVQRAPSVAGAPGTWTTLATVPTSTGPQVGSTVTYSDATVARKTTYFYQVIASNLVGSTIATFPNVTATSAPTSYVAITTN